MKTSLLVILVLLASLGKPVLGWSVESEQEGQAFWASIRSLVETCGFRPYAFDPAGFKILGRVQSACEEIELDGAEARFMVAGERFTAVLSESEFADDGDINDLRVYDSQGLEVASRESIAAFGDVLLALAGRTAQVREVFDPNVLNY